MMNEMLLGIAMLLSAAGASAVALEAPHAAVAPAIFSFELLDTGRFKTMAGPGREQPHRVLGQVHSPREWPCAPGGAPRSRPPARGFEITSSVSRDLPGCRLMGSFGARAERTSARFARVTSAKRSRVDRIIAVVAGASIGWVVGGGIGYAVTPKRGPYDDTSGLKGVLIGAPIGAVAGALIGYRLTK